LDEPVRFGGVGEWEGFADQRFDATCGVQA
jgi:hypothetical protein